jgi:hypothetical protein
VADLGGLPDAGLQRMDVETFRQLLDGELGGCGLKVMTISPSVDALDGYARTRLLLERGVLPALGHDRHCTEKDILGALAVAKEFDVQLHVTHMFNVTSFHHRDVSLCNFGMVSRFPLLPGYEGLVPPTVEVIGDGVHINPLTVQAVLSARGPGSVACVTDSVMAPVANARMQYNGRTLVVSPDARWDWRRVTRPLPLNCNIPIVAHAHTPRSEVLFFSHAPIELMLSRHLLTRSPTHPLTHLRTTTTTTTTTTQRSLAKVRHVGGQRHNRGQHVLSP